MPGVLSWSLGLSLSLESLQVVLSMGSFDVDDLILNAFGGLFGYFVMRLYIKLKESMSSMIKSQHMKFSKEGKIT